MTAPAYPQPLPANSRLLRDRRAHAWVNGPRNERGAYPYVADGRFLTVADAKTWADAVHPDPSLSVQVITHAALSGWRGHLSARRINGVWQ